MSSSGILEPPAHLDGPPAKPPQKRRTGDDGSEDRRPESASDGPSIAIFAVWVSLVPVFMLFGALIVAYVVRKDSGEAWRSVAMPTILWFNTLALLLSSAVLEWSRRIQPPTASAFRGYRAAFALGLVFVVGQVIAWAQYLASGVLASTTTHAGFFYVLTAVHAAHVLGGMVGLGLLALWTRHLWTFTTVPTLSRVTAVYWHFLGFLWLTMFLMLEFWR